MSFSDIWDGSSFAKRHRKKRRQSSSTLHQKKQTMRLLLVEAALREVLPNGLSGNPIQGKIALSDIGQRGAFVFTNEPIPIETEVRFTVEYPMQFYISAKVSVCHRLEGSGRLLPQRYNGVQYRIGISFIFESWMERESARNYVMMAGKKIHREV